MRKHGLDTPTLLVNKLRATLLETVASEDRNGEEADGGASAGHDADADTNKDAGADVDAPRRASTIMESGGRHQRARLLPV